jgi:hypothetical protein
MAVALLVSIWKSKAVDELPDLLRLNNYSSILILL